MSFLKYDNEHTHVCICQDCGRKFVYGTEADNEKYCLRCEHLAFIRHCDNDGGDEYFERENED